jgi:hypothetical protein
VSAPILTADKLDTKLDYDSVQAAGSMLGSASLIVLDEDTCIVRAAATVRPRVGMTFAEVRPPPYVGQDTGWPGPALRAAAATVRAPAAPSATNRKAVGGRRTGGSVLAPGSGVTRERWGTI